MPVPRDEERVALGAVLRREIRQEIECLDPVSLGSGASPVLVNAPRVNPGYLIAARENGHE